jgi:hypothetical protein
MENYAQHKMIRREYVNTLEVNEVNIGTEPLDAYEDGTEVGGN